jgi:hypothetical protein
MKVDVNEEELRTLAKNHTVSELAKHFGVTYSVIRTRLKTRHLEAKRDGSILTYEEKQKLISLLGLKPDRELAYMFHTSPSNVYGYRERYNVEKYVIPSHCPQCVTEPYARGFCHTCYTRELRRQKKENK